MVAVNGHQFHLQPTLHNVAALITSLLHTAASTLSDALQYGKKVTSKDFTTLVEKEQTVSRESNTSSPMKKLQKQNLDGIKCANHSTEIPENFASDKIRISSLGSIAIKAFTDKEAMKQNKTDL